MLKRTLNECVVDNDVTLEIAYCLAEKLSLIVLGINGETY